MKFWMRYVNYLKSRRWGYGAQSSCGRRNLSGHFFGIARASETILGIQDVWVKDLKLR